MRYREPFVLFPKKLASGKTVYYYTTYDLFNNRKQYSTGETTKSKARRYCLELFKNEELLIRDGEKFSKYVENWYVYDKCPHIQSLLARGKTYSKTNAKQQRSRLIKKIVPYLGNVTMNNITTRLLEEWLVKLKKDGLTNMTINTYLTTLRVIINFAFNNNDIKTNPIKPVKNLADDIRKKSTLKEGEIKKLLDPKRINEIWYDETYYVINYLAANTGMRAGEIMALQEKYVKKDHIVVKHNWDRHYGLKSTKSGKTRYVPINKDLYDLLKDQAKRSQGEFLFMNTRNKRPFTAVMLGYTLYKAMENIGISEKERKERYITFHSWRHYYNTKLIKQGVPVPIIQAIIGHTSQAMTDNYTKLTKDDLIKALKYKIETLNT